MQLICIHCSTIWTSATTKAIKLPAHIECPKCKRWAGEPLSMSNRYGPKFDGRIIDDKR